MLNKFNTGGISFCGYNYCGGLSGSIPTEEYNSPLGLKPGSHYYIYYEPGKIV